MNIGNTYQSADTKKATFLNVTSFNQTHNNKGFKTSFVSAKKKDIPFLHYGIRLMNKGIKIKPIGKGFI